MMSQAPGDGKTAARMTNLPVRDDVWLRHEGGGSFRARSVLGCRFRWGQEGEQGKGYGFRPDGSGHIECGEAFGLSGGGMVV